MKVIRIDTFGSAWQSLQGLAAPTIFGDHTRDHSGPNSAIRGLWVGVVATHSSREVNSHEVEPAPDAVFVERLPNEPYFDGLRPSLVQRTAILHGTDRPWLVVYVDA